MTIGQRVYWRDRRGRLMGGAVIGYPVLTRELEPLWLVQPDSSELAIRIPGPFVTLPAFDVAEVSVQPRTRHVRPARRGRH